MSSQVQATIRFTIVVVSAVFLLYTNASDFDSTEVKSLIGIAATIAGAEVFTGLNGKRD